VARARGAAGPSFFAGYRCFLGLFWMTAPLAWLYAIPYERFLPAGQATAANLWTLGLVAAWRVVLISRVFSVLLGHRLVGAFCIVMVFGDTVALLAIAASPLNILAMMGGIHYTESQQVIYFTGRNLFCWGACTLPIWLCAAIAFLFTGKPAWQAPLQGAEGKAPAHRGGLLYLALASLGIWVILLPFPQKEQQLRYRVEQDLRHARCLACAGRGTQHDARIRPQRGDQLRQDGINRQGLHRRFPLPRSGGERGRLVTSPRPGTHLASPPRPAGRRD